MLFKQIYEEGLAQGSYFIGCQATGEAIVVDPRRDVEVYLQEAERQQMNIVAITETHIHADFLSGARELAQATGARMYLSNEGDARWKYAGLEGFDHQLITDRFRLRVGNLVLEAVHTPGHTPEHLSFLLTDGATTDQPGFMLTGDFVFVGDIGRPDLLEEAAGMVGTAEPGARRMFRSLREKFLTLPDYVQIWPGHGAGSACGKALGAVASTTVGYERLFAWWSDYLRRGDEEGFVKALLEGQPEAPYYFATMKRLNRDGMPLLAGKQQPARLSVTQFRQAMQQGALLVDTRDKLAFAGGHLPGAYNLPAGKNFSTWTGWLLPYDRPLILLADGGQIETLYRQLVRIGLDQVVGFIPGLGEYAPHELETVSQITAAEAHQRWQAGEVTILDVRAADEYRAGHIPGAQNLHAGRVMHNLEQVPRNRPLVVHCLGGDRSSIAISALMSAGFSNLFNLTGGIRSWQQQGFTTEKSPIPTLEVSL